MNSKLIPSAVSKEGISNKFTDNSRWLVHEWLSAKSLLLYVAHDSGFLENIFSILHKYNVQNQFKSLDDDCSDIFLVKYCIKAM